MRIALAPLNAVVGDLDGNAARITAALREAERQNAALLVCPELAVTGYPPKDLLDRPSFLRRAEQTLEHLAAQTRATALVVGAVLPNRDAVGQRAFNAAVCARHGKTLARYHKQLLPSYDVFDETRYFEPGKTSVLCVLEQTALGLSICEDIWNLEGPWNVVRYQNDPVAAQVAAGAELLINISASPYHVGKLQKKERLLRETAHKYRRPIVYVNQLGGNDSLIFDGACWVVDAQGRILHRTPPFNAELTVFDLPETDAARFEEPLAAHFLEEIRLALRLGLRDYVQKCGFERVVVALSGGIDSALVAALAVEALGADRVVGVSMPSRFSSEGSLTDARLLAERTGMQFHVIPIEPLHAAALETLAPVFGDLPPGLAEENIQSRLRGLLLMALSNKFGWLALTTGNKSELAMGYCTLYGDMCGGLAVIGDLPKTTVYQLARHINREREVIPAASLEKPPSAELRPNQRDTDSLPPYEQLDPILQLYIEEQRAPRDIIAAGHDPAVVARVVQSVNRAEYKRQQAAPSLKVTGKAFGIGRRLPIAAHFPDEMLP